jgi:hypothetical protein
MDTFALGMGAVVATLALCGMLMWWMDRLHLNAGRRVVISLVDGTWRFGRIRLAEVTTNQGDVPGTVVVFAQNVLTVQVMT